MRVRRAVAVLVGVACLVGVLSGCRATYEVRVTDVTLAVPCGGSTTLQVTWAIPEGVTPTGFLWLQHGFSRNRGAVADLQKRYAARGWHVIAPTIGSFGSCGLNSDAMRKAVADTVAAAPNAGSGLRRSFDAARAELGMPAAPLPGNVVLSGHSAGGALVTAAGGIVNTHPSAAVRARFKGLVLLDPVENGNAMATALPSLANKPVLTVSAPNSSCNSNSSGTRVLRAARSGFVGVRLPSGCHCDAEGDSTDGLCTIICGTPRAADKDALRRLALDWASDMLSGRTTADAYPGGATYERLRGEGTVRTL